MFLFADALMSPCLSNSDTAICAAIRELQPTLLPYATSLLWKVRMSVSKVCLEDMLESDRTITQKWLDPWWPSTRLGHDPLDQLMIDGRYAPVSVANWKLVPGMKRVLLAKRVPRPLTFV